MPRALLRGPAAFRQVRGEDDRVRRQVAEMPFNRPVLLETTAIDPNPDNPRKHFDEKALNELASNMKEIGQLHPCIVTLVGEDRYQLVAGERRWRAAVRAGLPQVWCVVRPGLNSLDRLRTAISENQMREDFTQADRVAALDALQALVEDAGLRGAGRALGISAGWLSRQLSLRRDPVLFPALEAGQVTFAQADEIRRAPAHLRQTLVNRALNGLASTEIRNLVIQARTTERSAQAVQREQVAGETQPPPSLSAILEALLALPKPSKSDRAILAQIREAVDQLLDGRSNSAQQPGTNVRRLASADAGPLVVEPSQPRLQRTTRPRRTARAVGART